MGTRMMEDELGLPPSMVQSPRSSSRSAAGPGKFASSNRQPSNKQQVQKYKYNKAGKTQPSSTVSGIEREELNQVVAQEMAQLKLFMKEVKGTRANDPDNVLKNMYRDRYRAKYLGEQAQRPRPQPQQAWAPTSSQGSNSGAEASAPKSPIRTAPKEKGTTPKKEIDWSVSNSDAVEMQVGNNKEQMGWVNQIPDGWDCGYTYRYAKDSVPPMARGVPMPANFGGGGGGGKCTQVLHTQGMDSEYYRITGRVPPQKTTEWVTWAQHNHGSSATAYDCGDGRAPLAYVNAAGQVQAVNTEQFGGSGKRGRNQAIDEMMSQRGGEVGFAPYRYGPGGGSAGWFGPSPHTSNHHDPIATRMNPTAMLHGERGVTSLGGGKKGRSPHMEARMAATDQEMWKSSHSMPQKGAWGSTGGGARGRNPYVDARQSSSGGQLW